MQEKTRRLPTKVQIKGEKNSKSYLLATILFATATAQLTGTLPQTRGYEPQRALVEDGALYVHTRDGTRLEFECEEGLERCILEEHQENGNPSMPTTATFSDKGSLELKARSTSYKLSPKTTRYLD